MTIKEIKLGSLNKLIEEMRINRDESIRNMIAYEITCRMYVPFKGYDFDTLLKENGYVEKSKNLTLNIK